MLPRPLSEAERRTLSALSEEGTVERLGVRLSGGALGLTEVHVGYEHRLKAFRARLVARAPLALGDGFSVPLRSELMTVLTSRVFVPARTGAPGEVAR